MKKEDNFILQILSDYINGCQTEQNKDIDWNEILSISRNHEVEGIVFYQCRYFLPKNIYKELDKTYALSIYCYISRNEELKRISTAFKEKNISFFLIKGPIVAQYYPDPMLRTMGDVDIVIHKKDRIFIYDIMNKLGYTKTTCWDNKEEGYKRNNIYIEIHDRLIYKQIINRPALEMFFADFWPYVKDDKIDINYHFLFLILHLRKHFLNSGVGFRMFMDIALMSKNEPELDWSWIKERLIELEMMDFTSCCFELIHLWFGIESPFDKPLIDSCFFNTATEDIFRNGVFGYNNTNNRINEAVNVARYKKKKRYALLKQAIKHIIPSYETMKNNENYHFINTRPWLLPVAWIYRFYRALKQIQRGRKNVLFHFASHDEIDKRDLYLRKWGL